MKKPRDSHLVIFYLFFYILTWTKGSHAAQGETKLKGFSLAGNDVLLMIHAVIKEGTIHICEQRILPELKLLHRKWQQEDFLRIDVYLFFSVYRNFQECLALHLICQITPF